MINTSTEGTVVPQKINEIPPKNGLTTAMGMEILGVFRLMLEFRLSPLKRSGKQLILPDRGFIKDVRTCPWRC